MIIVDAVATTPPDGFVNVPTNTNIEYFFSEPMRPIQVGSVSLVDVTAGAVGVQIISVTMSNGNRTATVTPGILLKANTQYGLQLFSSGVIDIAGNQLPGSSFLAPTFTTGATADLVRPASPPTFNPTNRSIGVLISVNATVIFNEAIDPVSVLRLAGATSGIFLRVTATIVLVPVTYAFSADFRTVIMIPDAPLSGGTQYTIVVNSQFSDLAGDLFATSASANFTTQWPDGTASDQGVTVVVNSPALLKK